MQFLEGVQSGAGGALSGLRDARGSLLISIGGAWIVGVPAGMVLARAMAAPVEGMWLGLVLGACLRTALYLPRLGRTMSRQMGSVVTPEYARPGSVLRSGRSSRE
ncbi:MAG TPA: hypothetical protein VGH36_02560 [Acetobacteraceae bacterium]